MSTNEIMPKLKDFLCENLGIDACFGLNASRPIAKGDLKWRDALLVAHRVNSNEF